MKSTVFVTGDWVADWNLERPANLPEGYFDGSLQTQLHHRPGGAWYLAHLIENVTCRDLTSRRTPVLAVEPLRDPAHSIPGLDANGNQRDDIAHAYSVWWKQQRLNSGKKDDEVWRIARFAGCRKSSAWNPPTAKTHSPGVSLVAIDDLGLGFSQKPNAINHVTSHAGTSAKVLLKHGVRPDGSGILPKLLQKKLGERLHVVASANALRRRNADISRGLSWDKALEDLEVEFKTGRSSRDLAQCDTVVVHFGLAAAAVFMLGKLHRFFFLPDELEGAWEDERPGGNFGTSSVLTACMARHLLDPSGYPLFFAVTQALAAQRLAHEEGGGAEASLQIDLPYGLRGRAADPKVNHAAACIVPPKKKDPKVAKHLACVARFRAAWNPGDIPVWPDAGAEGLKRNRLLCNVTGTTPDSLHAKAIEVVVHGVKHSLASVPQACYEQYLTVDREEIESINEIRRLILEYKGNPRDKRPLSIAVFGAPGSGKSFAIKQVASTLFGKDKEPLEFNLTQIRNPEDLHKAFHQVRDASIRHEIPLVFWDEFDTANLRWLADFLAPMQDAEFFDGSHKHPFGKCIFVFAGGTRTTFEQFKAWAVLKADEKEWKATVENPWHDSFKALKGPDFVSRLRGILNIKGPNPVPSAPGATPQERVDHDPAYVLRRALILRSEIDRNFPHLIHPDTKRAAISPNVLHALLRVSCYEHGGRSISAVLSMSAVSGTKAFTVSCRPAREMLRLHVSDDFEDLLKDPFWSAELHEPLARAGFEAWKEEKIRQGYQYGETRNDHRKKGPLTHPLIKKWALLSSDEKAGNYDPVWRRIITIHRVGWRIAGDSESNCKLSPIQKTGLIKALLAPEHEIWLADHLTLGYELAAKNADVLRQHTDIKPFHKLTELAQELNRKIITKTIDALEEAGFRLLKGGKV